MVKEKILVAVKTYPLPSATYIELCCTAGFRKDGSWIRLFPVPFRLIGGEKAYKKYQWIEADIAKSRKDPRPESYKIQNIDTMQLLERIDTKNEWEERRRLTIEKNTIYKNLAQIIAKAHKNELSLVIFRPKKIIDFIFKKTDPVDDTAKAKEIENLKRQGHLLEENKTEDFIPVQQLPYKFFYKFEDDTGKGSTLMIEDWEICALYLKYRKSSSEEVALKKVKTKYLDELAKKKDLYLFLGTTKEHHLRKARNPYVIIGVFYPPYKSQLSLF